MADGTPTDVPRSWYLYQAQHQFAPQLASLQIASLLPGIPESVCGSSTISQAERTGRQAAAAVAKEGGGVAPWSQSDRVP